MAHFAKIDNGVVQTVIVAEQEWIDQQPGTWVQTSYTGTIRKNFAGIGYSYDESRDAFIPPCPGEGYVLNEETCRWEESQ